MGFLWYLMGIGMIIFGAVNDADWKYLFGGVVMCVLGSFDLLLIHATSYIIQKKKIESREHGLHVVTEAIKAGTKPSDLMGNVAVADDIVKEAMKG